MNLFKWLWDLHKWTGLALCLVLALISVTGFLLLVKKEFASLQPPTQRGAEGDIGEFISIAEVLEAARSTGDPAFATFDDIDRIDVRPDKRVHKVRSVHDYREVQVCAVTGAVLSQGSRTSDWIEALHDGSWFADAWHDYGMPIVALGLLFLCFSGVYIWITPTLRKRRRKRAARAKGASVRAARAEEAGEAPGPAGTESG